MDSNSISGGRSTEGDHTGNSNTGGGGRGGGHMDSAGQATSLSSLEEVVPGLAKRTRRKPPLDRQHSDSSNWTVCGEDGGSERVRFDDHVSFIEADRDQTINGAQCNNANNRTTGGGRRKRNKEVEQQDLETQKLSKYVLSPA